MNLRDFYKQVRDLESTMPDKDCVVVSLRTPDGGIAGVASEAPRSVAARLIVQGKARLATEQEATAHRTSVAEEHRRVAEERSLSKPSLTVLSDGDLRLLRSALKKKE